MTAAPVTRPNPLDQALRYLGLGFSVIPLKARDKRPAISSWKEYQTRRATVEEVTSWFGGAAGEKLNIGLVTGAVSGLVVIDADDADADAYVSQNYPTPIRTKTSHGRHHWFAHPAHEVRNGAKLKGRALDVRADGGYVVAPGSVHPDGSVYLEEGDWSLLADCPVFQASWLGEKVQPLLRPVEVADAQLRNFINAIPGAPEGKRDSEAFRVACKLVRDKDLGPDRALEYLRLWNEKCTPPLPDADLQRKVISAQRYGQKPYGSDKSAQSRGPEVGAVDDGGSGSLMDLLVRDARSGLVKRTPGNLAKILRLDPQWGTRLQRDEMTMDVLYDGKPVTDSFVDFVQEEIEDHYRLSFGREEVAAKLVAQANATLIHPVREMLLSLPIWDGVERLSRVGKEILGNGDTLTTQYLTRFLVAACRRVLQPGLKVDAAPILVGPQGIGKSTFWAILAGQWFGDSAVDLDSKDGALVIHKNWITELGEIDHVTSAKVQERVKAFMSQSSDTLRPPFGKAVMVFKRSCVLVGSTNREGFLTDPTGSRRYWPIKVDRALDNAKLRAWRDQLLAEAMDLEANGLEHWLPPAIEAMRQDAAANFEADEPWSDQVDDAVVRLATQGKSPSDGFSIAQLFDEMGIGAQHQTRSNVMKLAEVLKKKGWTLHEVWKDGRKQRIWRPGV